MGCALLQCTNYPIIYVSGKTLRLTEQKATSWENTPIYKIEDQIMKMDLEPNFPNTPQETPKHAYFMKQALLMVNTTEHTSLPDEAHHQPGRKSPPDR